MSLSRKLAAHIITDQATLDDVMALLIKYKMLSLLPSVKDALIKLSLKEAKKDLLLIESPFPLSVDAVKKIKRIVGNDLLSHEVALNPSILSGFKARWRGVLYDGSAERIIKQLLAS